MGRTGMSLRELSRVGLMARVMGGELKLIEAADLMRVSYRQAKRLWKRYGEEGAEGLKHGSAGGGSNRAKAKEFRAAVLDRVREKYGGGEGKRFGPTLAAEHLASDDGLPVKAETLRRWMLAEGLWSRERKRSPYRQRREPKEHFGEMVQMDGSFHAWLEERGPGGCLMNMVDDATGTTLAQLGEQETTWAAAGLLRAWIEAHGIPRALYTDWKNVYVRAATEEEVRSGKGARTALGVMCAKLGIRIMAASSPQAKGRVERNHGVHQDRLIKKMRLKKISSFEEVNRYLKEEYLPEHNLRFAKPPASAADFHTAVPPGMDLAQVFCLEEERTIGRDWVVRYHNRLLQIQPQSSVYAPARSQVTVCEAMDGRLRIVYRGQEMAWQPIAERPAREWGSSAAAPPKKPWRPAPDHPWKRRAWPQRTKPEPAAPAPTGSGPAPGLVRVAASASP